MKLGSGVEWGVHCCLTLAWLDGEGPVSTAKLAAWFDLPPEYLKKQLQALTRAGILESVPGAHGGFTFTRRPESVTLMDVVSALEGPDELFQCTEIRQNGVGGYGGGSEFRHPCGVTGAMRRAELAWRRELAAQTIADLMSASPKASAQRTRRRYRQMSQPLA